jgi:MFS family permease
VLRPLRWYDLFTVNVLWLGLSSINQTMTPLIVPLLVQQFVGEGQKGTYYGTLRLWSLMVALLVQALMGILSDHSTLRFGRRRPFIFAGTLLSLICIALIGFSSSMQGLNGYWFLFGMVLLLAVCSNMAQGAEQGLIPDLVPAPKRGLFSGVKAVLEIPLPFIIISFTIGRWISRGMMTTAILAVMGLLAVSMGLTMFVPETRLKPEDTSRLDWRPFLRLAGMAGLFTVIILGLGQLIQWAGSIAGTLSSIPMVYFIMGVTGLASMLCAVGLGVWVSTQVGLGRDMLQKSPSFTWWIVNRLAFLVGVNNLASFTVYFLQTRLGFVREKAAGPAANLTMFVGVFILLSTLPSGWLADRFGHKRLVALSGIVAASGTLVALSTAILPVIYLGGCLIGVGGGLFYTANWALGTDLVPKGEAGRYLGISNLAGAGAGAIGAYIGGPIADTVSRLAPQIPGIGYVILFAIYGVLFLFSTLVLFKVKKPANTLGITQAI